MRNGFILAWALASLALSATVPAYARDRDDVMAGAYRCGAVSNDKMWLDCYYGAAQPVRSSLGLPSAPESQLRLAANPPAGGMISSANVRGGIMADAARCYSLADDRRWLECYYDAASPVRSLLGLTPDNRTERVSTVPESAFALRKPAPISGNKFSDWLGGTKNQRVIARVSSYTFDKYGIFTVVLDNGQVWQQQSGDTSYARWKEKSGKYTAILTRGALGSIDLRIQGEPRSFKVTRLQ